MYSDKDFQTFWFRYKTEGEPHGISINSFCINQGVPYKQFYAWFKKHATLCKQNTTKSYWLRIWGIDIFYRNLKHRL